MGQQGSLRFVTSGVCARDASGQAAEKRNELALRHSITSSAATSSLSGTGQRRRAGGATPADCGCFAMAKSNVAGFEYQYGGGTWRRKSSSAAFIAAMVCAA
jgi:hypothetical protein